MFLFLALDISQIRSTTVFSNCLSRQHFVYLTIISTYSLLCPYIQESILQIPIAISSLSTYSPSPRSKIESEVVVTVVFLIRFTCKIGCKCYFVYFSYAKALTHLQGVIRIKSARRQINFNTVHAREVPWKTKILKTAILRLAAFSRGAGSDQPLSRQSRSNP